MKTRKPEVVQSLKCSDGSKVDTLQQWKRAECSALFGPVMKLIGQNITVDEIIKFVVENMEELVAILSIKEPVKRGPKTGSKRKPKNAVTPAAP